MSSSTSVTVEMSDQQKLKESNPRTAAALNSALNNITASPSVKKAAMESSTDFSLQAAPSIDLYLNTQKQKKKGKNMRPGMNTLFERAAGGRGSIVDGSMMPDIEGRDDRFREKKLITSTSTVGDVQPTRSTEEKTTTADIESSTNTVTAVNTGPAGTKFSAAIAEQEKVKFGMFEGVFARCLLNIWGVIMFVGLICSLTLTQVLLNTY